MIQIKTDWKLREVVIIIKDEFKTEIFRIELEPEEALKIGNLIVQRAIRQLRMLPRGSNE